MLGLAGRPRRVRFNGGDMADAAWEYDGDGKVLRVRGLGSVTAGGAWNKTWTLAWE